MSRQATAGGYGGARRTLSQCMIKNTMSGCSLPVVSCTHCVHVYSVTSIYLGCGAVMQFGRITVCCQTFVSIATLALSFVMLQLLCLALVATNRGLIISETQASANPNSNSSVQTSFLT